METLLNMLEFNSNDSVLVMRRSVHWSWGTVVRRQTVTAVRVNRLLVGFVLDLVFKDDVPDFL